MRGLRRLGLAVALLAAPGCLSSASLDLSSFGEAGTLLLWSEDAAWVVDLAAPRLPGALSGATPTYAAHTAFSADALGLAPGALVLEGGFTRPLPEPYEAYALVRDGARWRLAPDPAAATAAAALRLPDFDDLACLERGGCRPEDGAARCLSPCPAPGVASPAPPSPDCPPGWLASEIPEGAPWCAPPRPPPMAECPDGQAWWPVEADCAPVDECSAGDFRAVAGPARYVRTGASGSGTREDPAGDLDAVLRAADGATVVLAGGRYEVSTPLPPGLRLLGRCAESTEVVSTGDALEVPSAGVSIEHLTVASPLAVTASASLAAVRVRANLDVEGASFRGTRLWIDGANDGARFADGADAQLAQVSVERSRAVRCVDGARLRVDEAVVREASGAGLLAKSCARLEARRVRIEDAATAGLQVTEATAEVRVEDLVVRRVAGAAVILDRRGFDPTAPAGVVSIARLSTEQALFGVLVLGSFDLEVRGLVATATRNWALSFFAEDGPGTRADVAGVWLDDTRGLVQGERKLNGTSPRTTWRITDAVARASDPRGTAVMAEAVVRLIRGARLRLERAYIGPGKERGITVTDASAELLDVTVDGPRADGVLVEADTDTVIERLEVRDARNAGVLVGVSADLRGPVSLRDVRVRAGARGVRAALGVQASAPVPLDLRRFTLEDVALGVEARPETRISQGTLTRCGVGLALRDGAQLAPLTSGLRVECDEVVE